MTRVEQDAAGIADPHGLGVTGDHNGAPVADVADPVAVMVDAFRTLADLPFVLEKSLHELRRIVALLKDAAASDVWAATGENSNLAATAYGTGGTLPAFYNPSATNPCCLRNILVGGQAAGIVQLVKARIANSGGAPNPVLLTAVPVVVVATVRLTTTQLSQIVPQFVVLAPGESLHLITSAATPTNLDFSAEYKVLASE